jgi:hypothetical protein
MQREVPSADMYAEKAYIPEGLEAIYAAARQWRARGRGEREA